MAVITVPSSTKTSALDRSMKISKVSNLVEGTAIAVSQVPAWPQPAFVVSRISVEVATVYMRTACSALEEKSVKLNDGALVDARSTVI